MSGNRSAGTAQEAAGQVMAGASAYLDSMIEAAERGIRLKKEELNLHIHAQLGCGSALDDRLVEYVARHGLQPRGKRADIDTGTRDVAWAIAVVLRMKRGEKRKDAIQAVADLAHASFKAVERAFKLDIRKVAEACVDDPKRRRVVVAMAAPYLA